MLSNDSIPASANFSPGFTVTCYQCRQMLLQWYGRQRSLPFKVWPDLFNRVADVMNREPDATNEATYLALCEEIEDPTVSRRSNQKGKPGAKPKYPPELIEFVRELRQQTPQPDWKKVFQQCKKMFPKVKYPPPKSFTRYMQRKIQGLPSHSTATGVG